MNKTINFVKFFNQFACQRLLDLHNNYEVEKMQMQLHLREILLFSNNPIVKRLLTPTYGKYFIIQLKSKTSRI